VERGSFGDVWLDDLNFSVYVNWPGAIHEGNGEGVFLIDERADARQQQAISTIVRGNIGGPWSILGGTWPTLHGPIRVPYEIEVDGIHSRVKAGDALIVESTAIKNAVTGAAVHPGIVLPEGIIVKRANLGCSTTFRVTGRIAMDHSGQYTAVGPFEYAGS
jgi:hypothetical protein